uniref:Uncharacterized protein n=1 Tax=viral metagenome TaxID=1070528 RepID=A0A6M3L565_9ZZZZ
MIGKRINRTDPEQLFIVGYNSSAASWSNGYWVRWDYSTDVNGVGMETPAAQGAAGVGYAAVCGVVAETIASGAYGLIQVYGYHSAARVKAATGGAIAAGTALACASAAGYELENVRVTGTKANCYPKGFSYEAYTLANTTAAKKVHISCL